MIYPIVAYGHSVLRQRAQDVPVIDQDLHSLIESMYETMYNANGVGLAAPQIGKSLRLFVVDAEAMDEENLKGFKKVFINPQMLEESGEPWVYEEGCLSIPGIHGDVERKSSVRLKYQNEHGEMKEEVFEGLVARVIQHEYDHIEGILFTDHLSALKKRLLKSKLSQITKGKTTAKYRMVFP